MRVIRIIDQLVLLAMSLLLLLDLLVWSSESIKYIYICYYLIRWFVIPFIKLIHKHR